MKNLVPCTLLALAIPAQSPQFRMDPAVSIQLGGASATHDLTALPGSAFVVALDLDGGPTEVLGERLLLGLTPSLVTIQSGLIPPGGTASGGFSVPLLPFLAGVVVYGQGIVLDPAAPNGVFRASNGASTALFGGSGAVGVSFDGPLAGFTGSFAADVAGHVRGGPVTTRTHQTIDPQGVFFLQPIQSPLVPFGCRQQMVFRTQDVGATGEPELLTGIRWRPHPAIPVSVDVHTAFELRAGHTPVVPDYSIDPFSALPSAPLSGLSTTFAANTIAVAPPQVLYQGAYIVDPADLLPSGYLPYPLFAPFRYDGLSSLLLEFRVGPNTANGTNGGVVRLMIQSNPEPFARVLARGSAGAFLVPAQTAVADVGDNAMHDLELEFTRVETFCESPWLDSGAPAPDYGAPVIARSLPPGTSVQASFRGAATAAGTNPTAWSPSPDVADGLRHLQFRLVFHSSAVTGERPLVDSVVVPLQ